MKIKGAFFFGLLFFVLGFLTLPDYGINWDTINHLPRGQVYLRYFLTGKKDFSALPAYKMYWQKPEDLLPAKEIRESKIPARSFYQNNAFTFNWYMEIDGGGHPPLSDILSSVFNRILFGNLKIVNDTDSYRVYGLLLASILVGLVFYWTESVYGTFSGIIAALSLGLYPLFWAESHFNTEKDIPEAAFFFFFVYSFWKGFIQKSWKWILVSGLFFGLALGTKFNILFAFFIVVPWLFIYLRRGRVFRKGNLKLFLAALGALFLGIVIFYSTWPYLWQDLIGGTLKVFAFYKEIGTTSSSDSRFLGPWGINFYAPVWLFITTPIIILLLFVFGLLKFVLNIKRDKTFTGLILTLGFAVPLVRVSLPHANIYGGIRQIMEYVPFMAVIAGVGAGFVIDIFRGKVFKLIAVLVMVLSFGSLIDRLYRIHPNENVFFNSIIGGLRGAKEMNIPSWGNSFGGAYRQAFKWINENAEKDSRLVYAYELMPNAPWIWVRPDISFSNSYRSGFLVNGEYVITLTYDGTINRSYFDSYLENLFIPVYESKVDDVSVIKVWKNDVEHLKPEYKNQKLIKGIYWKAKEGMVLIDLKEEFKLSYLKATFSDKNCKPLVVGKFSLSVDNIGWQELKDRLPMYEIGPLGLQPSKNLFYYPFVGNDARYIRIDITPIDSCLSNISSIDVYSF